MKIKFRVPRPLRDYHDCHGVLYCTYFGTIVEKAGWSLYGASTGGLLVLTVIALFITTGGDHE